MPSPYDVASASRTRSPYDVAGASRAAASPYDTASAGSSSETYSAPPAKKDSYTPWGFTGNLLSGAETAIRGLYPLIRDVGVAFGKDAWNADITNIASKDEWDVSKSNLGKYVAEAAPAAAKQYATYYGPTVDFLKSGDPSYLGKQAKNFYDDPFQIVTDLLGGVGVAGKLGVTGKAAGILSDQNALVRLGRAGEVTVETPTGMVVITKQTAAGRPVAKLVSKASDKGARAASVVIGRVREIDPAAAPVFGEYARAARVLRGLPQGESLKWQAYASEYARAWGKLSAVERQAVNLHMMFPVKDHLDQYRAVLADPENPLAKDLGFTPDQTLLSVLNDPKVIDAYDKLSNAYVDPAVKRTGQTGRMVGARDQAADLAEKYRDLLVGKGRMDEATAFMRQYLPTRFATGERFVNPAEIQAQADLSKKNAEFDIQQLEGQAAGLERQAEKLDRQAVSGARASEKRAVAKNWWSDEGKKAPRAPAPVTGQRLSARADELRAQAEGLRSQAEARKARLQDDLDGLYSGWQGGEDVLRLRKLIEETGQPQPVYLPHRPAGDFAQTSGVRHGTGGGGGPQRTGLQQNRGVLMETGLLTVNPDLLGPAFLRRVQVEHYDDLHKMLLHHAIEVTEPALLPRGYKWIRRNPSERIPYTTKTAPAHMEDVSQRYPELDTRPKKLEDPNAWPDSWDSYANSENRLFEDSGNMSEDWAFDVKKFQANLIEQGPNGGYMAVPENFVKSATGEFTRSISFIYQFVNKPTRVWRMLVLGLRPAYVVNNTVGNHLLLAMRFAGYDGLRAYLNMIYNTKGAAKVREMLNMPDVPRGLSREFMREFFPQQVEGTFIGTNTVDLRAPRSKKLLSKVVGESAAETLTDSRVPIVLKNAVATGVIKADRAVEAGLRRTATETALRKDPAFRDILDRLDSQAKSFEQITEEALRSDPQLATRVNAEVNAALGDYLKMSALERGTLRNVMPFYAWFKAITKISLRTGLDMPARTAVISQLAEVANEFNNEDLGPVPSFLEGALKTPFGVLKTGGFNPYTTLPQLRSAAGALFPGADRQNARDALSLMNPFGASLVKQVGGLNPDSKGALVGSLWQTFGTVPQARLFTGSDSQLYDTRKYDEFVKLLGAPLVDLNERQAARMKAEGR